MLKTLLLLAAFGLALAGCATQFGATQVAQFRHPTGRVQFCAQSVIPAAGLADGIVMALRQDAYARCKSRLEQAGYVRVPVDAGVQAEIDRYDAARADSIKEGRND